MFERVSEARAWFKGAGDDNGLSFDRAVVRGRAETHVRVCRETVEGDEDRRVFGGWEELVRAGRVIRLLHEQGRWAVLTC